GSTVRRSPADWRRPFYRPRRSPVRLGRRSLLPAWPCPPGQTAARAAVVLPAVPTRPSARAELAGTARLAAAAVPVRSAAWVATMAVAVAVGAGSVAWLPA